MSTIEFEMASDQNTSKTPGATTPGPLGNDAPANVGASAAGDTQVPAANKAYEDQLGVTGSARGLGPDTDAIRRQASQQKAQHLLDDQERAAIQAAKAEMERLQRETEQLAAAPDAPVTKFGDGGVKVRYLGTSDAFDFGSDDDGKNVVARAGGDPVDIPQELYDRVKNLPYDQFEETK